MRLAPALLSLAAATTQLDQEELDLQSLRAGIALGAHTPFDAAAMLNGGVEGLGLSPVLQALLAEAWNDAYARDPQKVQASLVEQPRVSRPPPRISKKSEGYNVLKLNEFPNFEVRIKDPGPELKIDKVQQYSGYVDVLSEDKHFFFWLWESRNDPKTDPVVLWLNGGPGCSSATGEFFELGPGFVTKNLTTEFNPNAWNSNATVIFLDQPVNVGYSYSDNDVFETTIAAEDVYQFLEILFASLPQYRGLPFHISGESYAGKYLPAIGAAILGHEDRSFNLSSVVIGNPITDPAVQAFSSVAMACGDGGYPSVLSEEKCLELYRKVPYCESLLNACSDSDYNYLICQGASLYCAQIEAAYEETGRNYYDISDECGDECYPEINYIDEFMRQPRIIKAVGSDVDEFVGCNYAVGEGFALAADGPKNEGPDVLKILESGVDILFYDGALDWICSWPGVYELVQRLRYEKHAEFTNALLRPWVVDGEVAGETKSAGKLTWLKVYGAGHMVPHNQGRVAKVIINQWLQDRALSDS